MVKRASFQSTKRKKNLSYTKKAKTRSKEEQEALSERVKKRLAYVPRSLRSTFGSNLGASEAQLKALFPDLKSAVFRKILTSLVEEDDSLESFQRPDGSMRYRRVASRSPEIRYLKYDDTPYEIAQRFSFGEFNSFTLQGLFDALQKAASPPLKLLDDLCLHLLENRTKEFRRQLTKEDSLSMCLLLWKSQHFSELWKVNKYPMKVVKDACKKAEKKQRLGEAYGATDTELQQIPKFLRVCIAMMNMKLSSKSAPKIFQSEAASEAVLSGVITSLQEINDLLEKPKASQSFRSRL